MSPDRTPQDRASDPARVGLACLTMAGLALIAFAAVGVLGAAQTLTWPSTEGTVLWSRLKIVQQMHHGELAFRYGPDVHYRYTVDGREHQAARYAARRWLSLEVAHAKQVVDGYVAGDVIRVYYDPDRPQHAVLEPGFARPESWHATAGLGGAGCLGFAFLTSLSLRSRRRRAPSPACPSAPAPPS